MSDKTSDLIKKEAGIAKGSGTPNLVKVANLGIEQIIKVAKIKKDSMLVNSLRGAVKSVAGSCGPLGILVEGKNAAEICSDIDRGNYDSEIKSEKTDISSEKKKALNEELVIVNAQLAKEKEALEKEAAAVEAKPAVVPGEVKEEEAKEEGKEEKPEKKTEKKEEKKEEKKAEKKAGK